MMVGESGVLVFLYFFMVSHDYPRVMNRIWSPSTPNTIFIEESAMEDPSFILSAGPPNSPVFLECN